MTEYERLVNDRDIKAYEEMDNQNIYGKLPGFGGAYEADRQKKIIERAMVNGSPAQFSKNADVVIGAKYPAQHQNSAPSLPLHQQSPSQNYQKLPNPVFQANKARAQKSQIFMGGMNQIQGQPVQYRNEEIAQVNQNMMRPEAFRFRGNTGNTGYGFD